MKVKVAILGCSGRMGRNLIQAAVEHKSIELAGGSVRASSSFVNFDLGELLVLVLLVKKRVLN